MNPDKEIALTLTGKQLVEACQLIEAGAKAAGFPAFLAAHNLIETLQGYIKPAEEPKA